MFSIKFFKKSCISKTPNFSPGSVVYKVVSSPPATEEIGATGREIESRQDLGW
jgi:hypothetical protein